MLTIKVLRSPTEPPIIVEGSTIIIEELNNVPAVVIVETQLTPDASAITVATANEPRFNDILAGLGIDKIVIHEPLEIENNHPAGAKLLMAPKR